MIKNRLFASCQHGCHQKFKAGDLCVCKCVCVCVRPPCSPFITDCESKTSPTYTYISIYETIAKDYWLCTEVGNEEGRIVPVMCIGFLH